MAYKFLRSTVGLKKGQYSFFGKFCKVGRSAALAVLVNHRYQNLGQLLNPDVSIGHTIFLVSAFGLSFDGGDLPIQLALRNNQSFSLWGSRCHNFKNPCKGGSHIKISLKYFFGKIAIGDRPHSQVAPN